MRDFYAFRTVPSSCHKAVKEDYTVPTMAEVLVVASKVRSYIKEKGECNTASETIEALSQAVEKVLDKAIEAAKSQGRKTVMARDVVVPYGQ
jgi:histone H3/H4